MSLEANKEIVRRVLAEFWLGGNVGVLDELFAPDYVNHELSRPEVKGLAAYKEWANEARLAWKQGFPDFTITIEDLVAEDDRVAKRWILRGTHTGEFLGTPPTNRKVTMLAMTLYRTVGGKVREIYWNYDALGLMQQLGGIQAPAEQAGASA
jgi:predicted ester cyclase